MYHLISAKTEKAVSFKEEVQVLDFESDEVTIDEVMLSILKAVDSDSHVLVFSRPQICIRYV
jgi:hypothetical protein